MGKVWGFIKSTQCSSCLARGTLCTQFVYFLSFHLLLMYFLHSIYCVMSVSAITTELSQHDLHMTLCHFLFCFEYMFSSHSDSIHPWFTSFFVFSLSCFHLPSWTISWCLAWLFGPLTGQPHCHSSLSDLKGGVSAQSGLPFAPYPASNPCEWASVPGTRPRMEKGKEWNLIPIVTNN